MLWKNSTFQGVPKTDRFTITEKWKTLATPYPKPTAETFFFLLELSNVWTQILAPLRLFFYPHKLSFSLPTKRRYDKVPSHSACPCFRLHKGRMQERSCCKNNCASTNSQLLSKETQHTNLRFVYFCGVRIISHFHQHYPNTLINEVKADELWLVVLW